MVTDVQIADKLAEFYADPLGFILFAFPWGEKGGPLEQFPDGPDEWHRDLFVAMAETVLTNLERKRAGLNQRPFRAAVASGHGIGKSACVAWLILWVMSTRPWCRGIVTANTAEQLQTKTWPELGKWHSMMLHKHWFKWTATQFYFALCPEDQRKNYCFDAITWSEERTEGFAGLHNANSAVCLIFDEASAIPDVLWEVASGALTDGEPFFFAFGNPTRNTGRFRECFGRDRKLWWTRNVDSRSVRITNKDYLQELVDQYGEDSDYVKVRVRGEFPSAGDRQFIGSELIDASLAREAVRDMGAPLLMGVDVARYGEDKTVLAFRRGSDARSIPWQKYRSLDTMQSAAMVIEAITTFNPQFVFIDGVGVGGGVVDRIRQMGFKVVDVNAGGRPDNPLKYKDKRAEMWGEMKTWLGRGGAIPNDRELIEDLIGPQYSFTDKQQIRLERKDDMKKRGLHSPDVADALALTFASKAPHRALHLDRRNHNRRTARNVDYDVFDHRPDDF
jgi:hypothetical protein